MVAPFIRSPQWRYSRHVYAAVAVAAVATTILTFQVTRVNPEPSHSLLALFFIKMTIVVPEIVLWLLAARSGKRFKQYAVSIKAEADGRNLNLIANGLLWLLGYIMLFGMFGPAQALAHASAHPKIWVSVTNHLPVLLALSALISIFLGSRGLAGLARQDFWTRWRTVLLFLPFATFMTLFTVNFYEEAPQLRDITGNLRFVMPVKALLLTYVLPHLVVWTLGLLSCINLWWYARKVNGSIYKALFTKAQRGLVFVLLAIFCAQLLISSPYAADNFQLGIMLWYAVLVLAITGYSLIYRGAKQLQKIEDVV